MLMEAQQFNYYYARNKYNIKFVSEGRCCFRRKIHIWNSYADTGLHIGQDMIFEGWEPAVTLDSSCNMIQLIQRYGKKSDDVVYTTKYYLENENQADMYLIRPELTLQREQQDRM